MKRLFLLATALCAISAPAHAEIINLNFNLNATNFFQFRQVGRPETPPIQLVNGTFRLVFDNASNIQATSNGLTVTGFNLLGTPLFAYNRAQDVLAIGTQPTPGTFTTFSGRDNFGFFLLNASKSNYSASSLSYTSTQASGFFRSNNVTVTAVNSAVPEPASWAMMIGGFGFVGGALRHRKRRERALSAA